MINDDYYRFWYAEKNNNAELRSKLERLKKEKKASWDSAEYNAARARIAEEKLTAAEQRIDELEKRLVKVTKNVLNLSRKIWQRPGGNK